MIDLDNLKFWYEKEEVDMYMKEQNMPIEDVLQLLITNIRKYARVPVSHFQVGAGIYTKSGRIFLGTNIELYKAAINHTVHAEQCALANMYLHTERDGFDGVSILSVTETPCGHCRQILQELPSAGDVRVIVRSKGIDCKLASLLPYSFELPVDGIVHHLFEKDCMVNPESVMQAIPSVIEEIMHTQRDIAFSAEQWLPIITHAMKMYCASFCCYSGTASVALFVCRDGRYAIGCTVESSAYNPTINCGQMAVVSCQVEQIEYNDIAMVIMIESKDALLTYKAFGNVLSNTLKTNSSIPFFHCEI